VKCFVLTSVIQLRLYGLHDCSCVVSSIAEAHRAGWGPLGSRYVYSDFAIPSLLAALLILFVCYSGSELFCVDDYSSKRMSLLLAILRSSVLGLNLSCQVLLLLLVLIFLSCLCCMYCQLLISSE